MDRIQCSVWNNGDAGWGFKVLDDPNLRSSHFKRSVGHVVLDLDGRDVQVNIAKKSFWTRSCGELIKKEIGEYIDRHRLQTNDRIWLRVIEPGVKFKVETT